MKPLLRVLQLICFTLVMLSVSQAAATWTTIDYPGASSTTAMGINNAGQIVGYYVTPDDINHGFIFEQGTYKTIDVPGAQGTYVFAINNDGDMVGGCTCNGGTQGFVTNGQDFTFIAFPGSAVTWALGINDLGQIVGSYGGTDGFRRAFTKNGHARLFHQIPSIHKLLESTTTETSSALTSLADTRFGVLPTQTENS